MALGQVPWELLNILRVKLDPHINKILLKKGGKEGVREGGREGGEPEEQDFQKVPSVK